MKQDDGKVAEIKLRGVKEALPIMHQIVDNHAAVQLGAHCLKNEVCINGESPKSALGNLKSMSMLKNGHAWLNLGINRCQQASSLDRNKVLGTTSQLSSTPFWQKKINLIFWTEHCTRKNTSKS
jgi:hypothetical protein